MKKALILYSTTDGQTHRIAKYILESIRKANTSKIEFTMSNLDDFSYAPFDLSEYDVIILGASVRYGKHKKTVTRFISDHHHLLRSKIFAFYSVCLTARTPEKATPETSRYVQKLYTETGFQPSIDAVFAGKLNYPKYNFVDRNIIRLIMKITGGPTTPTTVKEFTNWKKVDSFSECIKEALANI